MFDREVKEVFKSFEECKQHILLSRMKDTPSRGKIIELATWLYSIEGINCYPVDIPGIRFCRKSPSEDHFLCINYNVNSAAIHLLHPFSRFDMVSNREQALSSEQKELDEMSLYLEEIKCRQEKLDKMTDESGKVTENIEGRRRKNRELIERTELRIKMHKSFSFRKNEKKLIPLPDYMSLIKDNTRWACINGENITKLPFITIKQHVQDAINI